MEEGGRDFPFCAVASFVITVATFPVRSCCVLRKTGLIKDKALLEQLLSPSGAFGQVSVRSSGTFRLPVGVQV